MFTVLITITVAGSAYAAEQSPNEILVAMASFKSVCGGNTGRPCPGAAPAPVLPVTPPVSASPKLSPAPATPTPLAPASAPSTTATTALPATPSGGPAGYTFCGNENQNCSFSGAKSVAYGANSKGVLQIVDREKQIQLSQSYGRDRLHERRI